jgi:hypothetical protein
VCALCCRLCAHTGPCAKPERNLCFSAGALQAVRWHERCSRWPIVSPTESKPSRLVNDPAQTLPGLAGVARSRPETVRPATSNPDSGRTLIGLRPEAIAESAVAHALCARSSDEHHTDDLPLHGEGAVAAVRDGVRLHGLSVAPPIILTLLIIGLVYMSSRGLSERGSPALTQRGMPRIESSLATRAHAQPALAEPLPSAAARTFASPPTAVAVPSAAKPRSKSQIVAQAARVRRSVAPSASYSINGTNPGDPLALRR